MSDTKHVVLIHGTWARGDSWGPTRAAFEERGYTVHTPTLRHHELPLQEGVMKIAPLSMRDYTYDLGALVDSLDSPPLIVGLSLGGLLAQLVAARTRHAGVVAACPIPAAGIFAPTPTTTPPPESRVTCEGERLSFPNGIERVGEDCIRYRRRIRHRRRVDDQVGRRRRRGLDRRSSDRRGAGAGATPQ